VKLLNKADMSAKFCHYSQHDKMLYTMGKQQAESFFKPQGCSRCLSDADQKIHRSFCMIWTKQNTLDVQLHCVQKKTPTHIFFYISMNCGFKQKLQWIYPRIGRFW